MTTLQPTPKPFADLEAALRNGTVKEIVSALVPLKAKGELCETLIRGMFFGIHSRAEAWTALGETLPPLEARTKAEQVAWREAFQWLPFGALYERIVLPKLRQSAVKRVHVAALGLDSLRLFDRSGLDTLLARTTWGTTLAFLWWALASGQVRDVQRLLRRGGIVAELPPDHQRILLILAVDRCPGGVVTGLLRCIKPEALTRPLLYAIARRRGVNLKVLGKRLGRGELPEAVLLESLHIFDQAARHRLLSGVRARSLEAHWRDPLTLEDLVRVSLPVPAQVEWSNELPLRALRAVIQARGSAAAKRVVADPDWERLQREQEAKHAREEAHVAVEAHPLDRETRVHAPALEERHGADDGHPLEREAARARADMARLHDQPRPHGHLEDLLSGLVQRGELGVDVLVPDVLGRYFGDEHRAVIYMPVVRLCALAHLRAEGRGAAPLEQLEAFVDRLSLLVEVHEYAHGVAYRGVDTAGRMIEAPDVLPTTAHELWAQRLAAQFADHADRRATRRRDVVTEIGAIDQARMPDPLEALRRPKGPLRQLLDDVSKRQPEPYQAYLELDPVDPERARAALLEARSGSPRGPTLAGLVESGVRKVEAWLATGLVPKDVETEGHLGKLGAAIDEAKRGRAAADTLDALERALRVLTALDLLGCPELGPEFGQGLADVHLLRLRQRLAWDVTRASDGGTAFTSEDFLRFTPGHHGDLVAKNHPILELPALRAHAEAHGWDPGTWTVAPGHSEPETAGERE